MTTETLVVDRSSLSLAPLDLLDAPYGVPDEAGILIGSRTWRREWARSRHTHGATLVSAVKDLVEGCSLKVEVVAGSQTAVATAVATLVRAFEQWSYTLQLTLDAQTYAWECHPADSAVGVTDLSLSFGLVCPVTLSFARQPIPISGPV